VIRALKPDVLVKGAEYSVDQIPGAEFVIANGGNVVRPEMVGGISTTRTVEKMRSARR
jgi:D-beta-D-heptose 7-phosphate kinase/D-beta-D-heptose 1-phosphate adenosyltransferase